MGVEVPTLTPMAAPVQQPDRLEIEAPELSEPKPDIPADDNPFSELRAFIKRRGSDWDELFRWLVLPHLP